MTKIHKTYRNEKQIETRIVLPPKTECLPLLGIKKNKKLHLVMLQGE